MIQRFERQMKKAFYKDGRLKEYNISLGVNTKINEDRFYENEKGKEVCDVIVCFPDELDNLISEYDKSQTTITELKDEIEQLKKSNETLQNQLDDVDETKGKEIKKIKDEYSEKIDELKEDIHNKDIEIEKTKTEYERKIGNLKLFDKESHMSIIDHQKKIDELKDAHRKEIDALTIYNPESDMKIKNHNDEINGIKDTIVRGTISQKDTIGELEESLKFRNYIRGRHKTQIEELKNGVKYFAMISQYSESENEEFVQDVNKK